MSIFHCILAPSTFSLESTKWKWNPLLSEWVGRLLNHSYSRKIIPPAHHRHCQWHVKLFELTFLPFADESHGDFYHTTCLVSFKSIDFIHRFPVRTCSQGSNSKEASSRFLGEIFFFGWWLLVEAWAASYNFFSPWVSSTDASRLSWVHSLVCCNWWALIFFSSLL